MKNNQYAFPGKGGPLATAKILDEANSLAASGRKVLIVLWDFSNAFCTTLHNITLKIAQKFKLSARMTKLLSQFLEQSCSVIKTADKNGFYKSEVVDTIRGSPQGQIGSDFIFAMLNDGIDPETILDEIILRIKYVDDFTDVFAHSTIEGVFKSLKYNEILLKKQATSVGLKLNEDKLKIIPMNIVDSELAAEYRNRGPKGTSVYFDYARLLGFDAKVNGSHIDRVSIELSTQVLSDLLDPVLHPEPVVLRKQKQPKNSKISGEVGPFLT